MKVRILTSIAGHAMPHYGISGTFSLAPADELDLHDELAEKWIKSGIAEQISDGDGEQIDLPRRSSKKAGRK